MPKRSEGHLGSFIRAARELYCFAVIFDKCYCLLQFMLNKISLKPQVSISRLLWAIISRFVQQRI